MKEFKDVMGPVAECLNEIQGEANAYMGNLLPHLMILRGQLVQAMGRTDLSYAKSLAKALVDGFAKRFDRLFEDEQLLLATAVHPHWGFVAIQTLNPDKVQSVKNLLVQELVSLTVEPRAGTTTTTPSNTESGATQPETSDQGPMDTDLIVKFVLAGNTPPPDVALQRREEELTELFQRAVGRWQRTPTAKPLHPDLFPMEYRQSWLSVFLKHNTPLPSSAAVERIFSTAGDIIRPKRSCLTASNFEELVFLKGNLDLLDEVII